MPSKRQQGESAPRRSWEFETPNHAGHFILVEPEGGQYWTGDRWSVHIAEAMRFHNRREALQERRQVAERYDMRVRVKEAPPMRHYGFD